MASTLGLQWTDIDLDEPTITINRTVSEIGSQVTISEPKTRTSLRTLVFPSTLTPEFTAHRKRNRGENPANLLFHDSIGGPVRASNLRYRILDPAVRAIGLDGLTFHGLRHSAATQWVASGIDARTVQHRLGHTDPSLVLRLYAHSSTHADRQAADVVRDRFWPELQTPLRRTPAANKLVDRGDGGFHYR